MKQHNKSAKFKSDEIVDVKVTEVKGDKVSREVFEQRRINDVTDGVGAQRDKVLNQRTPIGPKRSGEMSKNVSTGRKFKMN